jgi:TetR/AcrR family transcriptional regulator, acrAB operon repressor
MARRTAEEAARTREALLDTALGVFAERGFAAAQLDDIAKRAELTRGALYHHFTDKADLFLAVLKERWGTVLGPVMEALEGREKPEARLRAFTVAFLDAMRTDPRARALMRMSLSGDTRLPELAQGMEDKAEALDAWVDAVSRVLKEAGAGRESKDRATALVIALNGHALWASMKPDAKGPDAEKLARCFLDGVLP